MFPLLATPLILPLTHQASAEIGILGPSCPRSPAAHHTLEPSDATDPFISSSLSSQWRLSGCTDSNDTIQEYSECLFLIRLQRMHRCACSMRMQYYVYFLVE